MKKILTLLCLMGVLLCSGCGYIWRGEPGSRSENSVLGTGSSTLRIKSVEQNTLYPWLTYAIRSQIRDEVNTRKLAVWADQGDTDFTLGVRIISFQIRGYGEYQNQTLLFTATINMELIVFDGATNTEVWRSGAVLYSENYENINEEAAIRDVVTEGLRRGMDRLQQRF